MKGCSVRKVENHCAKSMWQAASPKQNIGHPLVILQIEGSQSQKQRGSRESAECSRPWVQFPTQQKKKKKDKSSRESRTT